MRPHDLLVAAAIALFAAIGLGRGPVAADFDPGAPSRDLRAIVESDPALAEALLTSLAAAEWEGVETLEDLYAYVDSIVRLVPSTTTLLEEVRPFFYVVGQAPYLETSAVFQAWVKRFVSSYGQFLDTPESAEALQSFRDDPAFKLDDYYVGPSGWLTFNQFFARQLKPGMRPIAGLGDRTTIVAPADGLFRGAFPVTEQSSIVVKDIAYTIPDLLEGSDHGDAFAGGIFVHAYQAITDYHRFHLPFAGRILESKNVSGYVWLDLEKTEDGAFVSVDGTGFQWRQERGVVVVQTDDIGLVAIVAVGMGLVGDVVLTPDAGAELHKGEQFGFFQFGGSDVIVIFQKDRVEITAEAGKHYLQGEKIGVRRGAE